VVSKKIPNIRRLKNSFIVGKKNKLYKYIVVFLISPFLDKKNFKKIELQLEKNYKNIWRGKKLTKRISRKNRVFKLLYIYISLLPPQGA